MLSRIRLSLIRAGELDPPYFLNSEKAATLKGQEIRRIGAWSLNFFLKKLQVPGVEVIFFFRDHLKKQEYH